MIKDEKQLGIENFKTGLFGCVVALIVAILLKNMAILGGYILGFLISILIYHIDCKVAEGLLSSHMKRTFALYVLFFIFKMGIYAIGFLIAVKIPVIFSLFSVAVGYLTTKLTIYRLTLTRR